MTPGTRVTLGALAALAAIGLLVTMFSDSWYHSAYEYLDPQEMPRWFGAGGPGDGTLLDTIAGITMFVGVIIAGACGLVVGIGTAAGARRDHVPRLAALLAWIAAGLAIPFQALAVMRWPSVKVLEPRGFGWAMPVFFLSGLTMVVTALVLWREASRRARASAAALAKVNRELAAKDLAGMPELLPEEPPVERV
jgi:hypothetical protein